MTASSVWGSQDKYVGAPIKILPAILKKSEKHGGTRIGVEDKAPPVVMAKDDPRLGGKTPAEFIAELVSQGWGSGAVVVSRKKLETYSNNLWGGDYGIVMYVTAYVSGTDPYFPVKVHWARQSQKEQDTLWWPEDLILIHPRLEPKDLMKFRAKPHLS